MNHLIQTVYYILNTWQYNKHKNVVTSFEMNGENSRMVQWQCSEASAATSENQYQESFAFECPLTYTASFPGDRGVVSSHLVSQRETAASCNRQTKQHNRTFLWGFHLQIPHATLHEQDSRLNIVCVNFEVFLLWPFADGTPVVVGMTKELLLL